MSTYDSRLILTKMEQPLTFSERGVSHAVDSLRFSMTCQIYKSVFSVKNQIQLTNA